MRSGRFLQARLVALMFLEFFVWGAWIVPISSYMNGALGFGGTEIGWICGASALGALISPLCAGYLADRYLATEKALAALHALSAICLFLAVEFREFPGLMTLIVIDALFFMPTLSLMNNLIFRHLDDGAKFPRIAIGGNAGWIVAGLTVGLVLGERTGSFFQLAAAAEAVLALYCLTLPHTPPAGATKSAGEKLGLDAAALLRNPAFLVFAIAIPLVTISKTYYTTWTNAFMAEIAMPKPAAMMTLSQASELATMVVMPWFIAKVGLKNVLVAGMAAWVVRYFLFAATAPAAVVAGLLLHGFSYGFVVTGSSMYAARVAPPEMSARAQSFVTLLILGIGMFAGAQVAGFTGQRYQAGTIAVERPTRDGGREFARAPLPDWDELAGAGAERIDLVAARSFPQPLTPVGSKGVRYSTVELAAAMRAADREGDGRLSRDDWRRVRIHDWSRIWTWAAGIAAAACLLFWIWGREPRQWNRQGTSS